MKIHNSLPYLPSDSAALRASNCRDILIHFSLSGKSLLRQPRYKYIQNLINVLKRAWELAAEAIEEENKVGESEGGGEGDRSGVFKTSRDNKEDRGGI